MSYVFFDTETTGLECGFDQIIHFAAVRTDNDLRELERLEIRSRLLPHVVPHPVAIRTNGVPIAQLLDPELPSHYEMVCRVRERLLQWSPAIFIGYNSIRFDEEMLRHALFQCLQPAYLTSLHGNCRADALGLAMAASSANPPCLVVPVGPEGRPTFKLEMLAAANGIGLHQAHDALSDVNATVELCRRIRVLAPELWQRFVRFSKKATVADFVEQEEGFILTEFFRNQSYHTPAVCIGKHPDQATVRFCLELQSDSTRWAFLSDEDLDAELAKTPCPIRRIRTNSGPTLTALFEASDEQLGGLSIEEIEDRARLVKADADLCARIASRFLAHSAEFPPLQKVEERLYEAFPSPADEQRIARFHKVPWVERVDIVESLEDERLKVFGRRLIYVEHRSALSDALQRLAERDLTDRLVDEARASLTLARALSETDVLLNEGAAEGEGLLSAYRIHILERIHRVREFRARREMV